MGKRIGMAFGKDKGQAANAGAEAEEDPNKPPEPYVCTGHFQTDFNELCKRNNMLCVPPVISRPHRPLSPTPAPVADEKNVKKGGKGKQADVPPPEPEPEPELDENGEPPEPPPKTYVTKDKFDYFKPCIQVEMDNPDKQDTVTEMFVRGWKIDSQMMTTLKQCLPKMDRLHTVNFWNTGLTEETIEMLASYIPDIVSLKTLILDNNVVTGENWHLLIKEDSPVQNLSLRYNNITDTGCEKLGKALGMATQQNMKLLTLSLNGNKITDAGVIHLASGLRMNRTLLSLSLGSNLIGDKGAQKLAEVISRFPLTHEETVERRKLESEKGAPDRTKSVSGEKAKEDEGKHKGTKGKGGEPDKTKGKASVVAEATKAAGKGKDKGKGKNKGAVQADQEPAETPELVNPLLDTAEHLENGMIMLSGNRTLLNLNLNSNQIGEEGLKSLLLAVGYQTSITQFQTGRQGQNGLMRLCLNRNKVSRDNETLQKLNGVMLSKDPFYKPPPASPDQESQHSKVTN